MTVGSTRSRLLFALAFLLPNLLGFLVFTAGPVLASFGMSLTDLSIAKHNFYSDEQVEFIGLENYENILVGPESQQFFWPYFGNTVFLMLGIPLGIAGSLAISLLITAKIPPTKTANRGVLSAIVVVLTIVAAFAVWHATQPGDRPPGEELVLSVESGLSDMSTWQVERLRAVTATLATIGVGVLAILGLTVGSLFFRTAFYLPSLLAGVPMFLLWKTLYRPDGGLINAVLDPIIDGTHAVVTATPALLWQGLGVLLALASLGLAGRSVYTGVERVIHREAGASSFVGRLVLVLTMLAIAGGLVLVIYHLPASAAAAAAEGTQGFNPPEWLVSTTWAKPALIVMGVWLGVGGANMLLYIAGISNIPPELYEAADIDGANQWQRFINVTWPQLAPTTFFIVIMSTIGGLQGGFEQALIMTDGLYDTTVLTYYIYNLAFEDEFQLGLASAVAWVMFAIIFTMTVINYRFGSKLTNE
ncbi:MAG: sugar ABC transporter permease [Planctomycetota bacterium]